MNNDSEVDMPRAGLLVRMFRQQMENCNVSSGETIGLICDVKSRDDYVEASFAAANDIGADVFQFVVPQYGRDEIGPDGSSGQGGTLTLSEVQVESMKQADLVLDFTLEGFIHVPEREEISESGTRVLRAGAQRAEGLSRLMPWSAEEAKEQKKRVNSATTRMDEADTMRVVSEYGTDVTMTIKSESIFNSYGFVDEPGKWDVWGQNMVANYPTNVNGTVVMVPGDYNVVPFQEYYNSRVTCTLEDSRVVDITGDGIDADLMVEHLNDYDDEDVFGTSHFGWGLNDAAKPYNMAIRDRKPNETGVSADESRVWPGNMLWSTGPNPFQDRYAPCHYDIAMKHCSVYLDGEPVVEEGNLV